MSYTLSKSLSTCQNKSLSIWFSNMMTIFQSFDVLRCVILSPLSGKELIYFQHSAFVTNLCGILVSIKTVANCFHPLGFDILFRSNALIKSTIWVLGRTEPFNVNSPFGLHVMSGCFLM